MKDLGLSGGVIIIGSLLWDTKNGRDTWRKDNFSNDLIHKVSLPIRYGRLSYFRSNTYTMVFSNDCSDKLGFGCILKYKKQINEFNELCDQAIKLAKVEGIYKDQSNKKIFSSWGAVALLLSPTLDTNKKEYISKKWGEIYQNNINHSCYRVNEEIPSIDKNGFLNLKVPVSFESLDYLFTTPVTINVFSYPEAKDIAQAMLDNDYTVYFCRNRENGISTFQDNDIYTYLEKGKKHSTN